MRGRTRVYATCGQEGCNRLTPVHVLTAVDAEEIAALRKRDEFFWIDLVKPSDEEIEKLGATLDLHPVALEDTLEFGQRPKIDPYPDHLLLVYYTARTTGDPSWPAEPLEIHIYISGGFIATVRHDGCDALDELHARARRGADARRGGARLPRARRSHRRVLSRDRARSRPRSTSSRSMSCARPDRAASPAQLPAQAVRPRPPPAGVGPARPVPLGARVDPRRSKAFRRAHDLTCATSATTSCRSRASSSARPTI